MVLAVVNRHWFDNRIANPHVFYRNAMALYSKMTNVGGSIQKRN